MVFPLSCWTRVCMKEFREACTTSSSDNFQSLALSLLEINFKTLHFTDEDSLHKKINNTDFYVDYGVTEGIPENACNLNAAWRLN